VLTITLLRCTNTSNYVTPSESGKYKSPLAGGRGILCQLHYGLCGFFCLQHSYCILSLHFNGHFPGEPGLAGVYLVKQRMMDNWNYKSCKVPVKSSNQHPVFYRPDALPVAQPTVSKH